MSKFYNLTIIRILTFCVFDDVLAEKGIHHSSNQVTILSNMSKFYNLTIIRILTFCVFDEVLVSFHNSPDGNISFI